MRGFAGALGIGCHGGGFRDPTVAGTGAQWNGKQLRLQRGCIEAAAIEDGAWLRNAIFRL